MMTVMLRIILVVISIGTMLLMMHKIRQSKMQIEASVFWVFFALLLVVFSIFPCAADFLAGILGIYSTPNFLFLLIIFLLIVKLFAITIHISQLETKLKELVQRMALEEEKREQSDENHTGKE